MTSAPRTTTIFAQDAGEPGAYLDALRDRDGRWLEVAPFDDVVAVHRQGFTGAGQLVGVIDTGVLSAHPTIRRRIRVVEDLTGEGSEDENGHGTLVTLILLASIPHADIVSLKALGTDGFGGEDALLAAFDIAKGRGIRILNLSGGLYDPACQGDCALCDAAVSYKEWGGILSAAAGNRSGETSCPAKACRTCGVCFDVTAYDVDSLRLVRDAGEGTFGGPVGRFTLIPAE